MKENTKQLIMSIAIPVMVGILAALLTGNAMQTFEVLNKPPLSPPAWLFPVVWTILYTLMGISAYLIAKEETDRPEVRSALFTYYLQLFFNFIWSILFFRFEWYLAAFVWLVILWGLIFQMIRQFYPLNRTAAYLMIPYLLWVTFAGYLNLAIALLNP